MPHRPPKAHCRSRPHRVGVSPMHWLRYWVDLEHSAAKDGPALDSLLGQLYDVWHVGMSLALSASAATVVVRQAAAPADGLRRVRHGLRSASPVPGQELAVTRPRHQHDGTAHWPGDHEFCDAGPLHLFPRPVQWLPVRCVDLAAGGTLRYVRAVLGEHAAWLRSGWYPPRWSSGGCASIRRFDNGGLSCRYHHDA